MELSAILDLLECIAPPGDAEPWDNVGLLAGDRAQKISAALLTIDYTAPVAAEARRRGCNLVIAYHPPIFAALKRLTADHPVFDAIRDGIALYSPHTALDAADGGTNDMLADALGLSERRPLRRAANGPLRHKLVTFVPEKDVDRLSAALFDAGAGRIGDYSACSFRSTGAGTFLGSAKTHPAVGRPGRMELVPEVRLETIVPADRVEAVVAALRNAHPYEEPAFDLLHLAPAPGTKGMGRLGVLAPPVPRGLIVQRVKKELGLAHLLAAGPLDGSAGRGAVCAGSCGDLLDLAIAAGAEVYLTGEMRHHDALKAAAAGVTVLCTLHSNSERAVLARLGQRLAAVAPGLPLMISETDRDPFTVV